MQRGRLADLLRRHRRSAGLSQEALAERAGLSRRGLADLERGARRSPYPDTVRRLADALDLDAADRAEFMAACRPPSRADRPTVFRRELSTLVGRETELADLSRLAADARLLTLTGTGGVGKTRLALELANRTADRFTDGAVFVDLSAVVDSAGVPDTVAVSLGVRSRPGASISEAVLRHIEDKNLLLVLDNCEQVVGACADLLSDLLQNSAEVRAIATSREALHVPGETVWSVPPLAPQESVTLFTQRAQAADATTDLGYQEINTVADICAGLEGIPLAIELAAVRVPALGVTQVRELMADRFGLLSRGSRVSAPRHQTLRAAVDWSYDLLEPQEQRLFARLAVFADGWTLDAAQSVCSSDDLSPGVVTDATSALVEKSLVVPYDTGGARRYRFLETIRDYAFERLSAEDRRRTAARHAAYVQALVEPDLEHAIARRGIYYPRDITVVHREHANVDAALRWLLENGMLKAGLDLCESMAGFWLGQGFAEQGARWLDSFLAVPGALTPYARARALATRARFAEYGGHLDQAHDLFEESRRIAATEANATLVSRALSGLGDIELHRGRPARALDLSRQALDAARSAGIGEDTAQAMMSLGRTYGLTGDPASSEHWIEQALVIERQLGDPWRIAFALSELGQNARRTGRPQRALKIFEDCLDRCRAADTRMGERAAIMNLAQIHLELGMIIRAAEYSQQSLELSRELHDDDTATMVRCVEIAAEILVRRGEASEGVMLAAAATRRREVLQTPRPADEQSELDRMLPAARDALTEPEFTLAWNLGADLPISEAANLAMRDLSGTPAGS